MAKPRKHQDDKRRRDTHPWRAWYKLSIWAHPKRGLRALQLKRQPLCERHLAQGLLITATVANHNPPHRGNWHIFTTGNLESVCKQCHDDIIQGEEKRGYDDSVALNGLPTDPKHPFNIVRP